MTIESKKFNNKNKIYKIKMKKKISALHTLILNKLKMIQINLLIISRLHILERNQLEFGVLVI